MPKINPRINIQDAAALVIREKLGKDGSAWIKAIQKAKEQLRLNDTIEFDGKVLTFISRFSGKARKVTAAGCENGCDCIGISYHKALFAILSQRKVISFPIKHPSHIKVNQTDEYIEQICLNPKCGDYFHMLSSLDEKAQRANFARFRKEHEGCAAAFARQQREVAA